MGAWRDALAGFDTYADEERNLLFLANWWCLMHLADARQAAVDLLVSQADLLEGEPQAALHRALALYEEEAEALRSFAEQHAHLIQWWDGPGTVDEWEAESREAQQELLERAQALEDQALNALEAACSPA